MVKRYAVHYDGQIQMSFAEERTNEPWISLAGDCFFRNLHRNFTVGPLAVDDFPFTICFPRSRIDALMDYVEAVLPYSTEWLVLHIGANNLASSKFSGSQAASMLLSRCTEILQRRRRINDISICLLSPRLQDARGSYSMDYIRECNAKIVEFNHLISRWVSCTPRFTSIDFGLDRSHLRILLRDTGFGVNELGRFYLAEKIQAIIIWKRCSSRGPKFPIPRPLVLSIPIFRNPGLWSLLDSRRKNVSSLAASMSQQSSTDGW